MPRFCTVIVGAPELHDALRQLVSGDGEVLIYSDKQPLEALETITNRQPQVVVIERLFAVTSRGAALINRIKSDPALSGAEIRVVAHDGTYARVSPRRSAPAQPAHAAASEGTAVETVAPPAAGLDYRGTRRAARFRMAEGTEAQVDGAPAGIIDLSTLGAQILSRAPLKPAQPIRIVLADAHGMVRFSGSVAWVSFEMPSGVTRYRAGVKFTNADAKAVEAFRKRHKI